MNVYHKRRAKRLFVVYAAAAAAVLGANSLHALLWH